MIVICEPDRRDGSHVPFNAGLVEVARSAFPDEHLAFFGHAPHVEDVRRQSTEDVARSTRWETIKPVPRDAWYLNRILYNIVTLARLAKMLATSPDSRLVVTSFDSARLLALKLLERSLLKGVRIQVVSHGEIRSGVLGGRHRQPWRRFKETRTALNLFGGSSIQYLVLEHGIRERMIEAMPSLSGKIEVLEHPLPPSERSAGRRELSLPIRFGFLGRADDKKGFPAFLRLASETVRKYPGRAEFVLVGRLAPEQASRPEVECLTTKPQFGRISRDQFVEEIQRLHFAIMPYEYGSYELTPSGTLLDAIAWQIPIIATRLRIFERTFRDCGDIGHLCASEDEWHDLLGSLIESVDRARYRTQVDNLGKAQLARAPERLALAYRQICARQDGEPCAG